jgi:glutamate/tyrosine decarboxylase-like PLP-dependent enzyme
MKNSASALSTSSVILREAAERAVRYLEGVQNRRVYPSMEALHNLVGLGGALPERPQHAVEVIAQLDEVGSPGTVASTGGRYFGFVVGGALPATVAANWIASAWDQNACLRKASPVAAYLEDVVLAWLSELLRLPAGCGGAFVTGAQMATFVGLAAARHAVLERAGWNVESAGLFGAPPIAVVVSEEVHVTVIKALAMLGLGKDRVTVVPCDSQGRMRPDCLPQFDGPTIVSVQAGNVNSGSFDPVGDICELAHRSGAWVHVDGAFGLWAVATPERDHLTKGIEGADSWATDAHKWLNVPHESGIAFVREPAHLHAAMAITAPYLDPSAAREPMQWSPESSRRARAVEIWTALRCLGRQGVAELIRESCRHAATFADRLRAAGYEILNEVALNQVLVAFGDDGTTQRVIDEVQADGTCWCGGTIWHGRKAMRISVSSWATTDLDVERSLVAIESIASRFR